MSAPFPSRVVLAIWVLAASGGPSWAALPDSTDPVASYAIQASYDPAAHLVRGRGEILWFNRGTEPVGDLWFHLYLNAFRNEESAFFVEGRPGDGPREEGEWGSEEIRSLRLDNGYDLLPSFRWERPDDAPRTDRTVASVRLPSLVQPGGSVRVRIEWESHLPKAFRRTGWARDYVFAGQWFPKLAVFEMRGARGREGSGWNGHPYHAWTEFFADYGDYDVTLTLPEGWTVGATGLAEGPPRKVSGAEPGSLWEEHRFVARSVHDFAWVASPRLVTREHRFLPEEWKDPVAEEFLRGILGVPEADIPLREVRIVLLIPPALESQSDRIFRAACESIRGFGYLLGRYPYPNLTIVVPPSDAGPTAGMEYPTLITAGTDWCPPKEKLTPEFVIAHEFGHQYFYGVIGSNEVEEPWLDEGLNTWATARILAKAYGPDMHVEDVAGFHIRRMPLVRLPGAPSVPGQAPMLEEARALLLLRRLGVPTSPVLDYLRDRPFFTWEPRVRIPNLLARRPRFLEYPDTDPLDRRGDLTMAYLAYRSNAYDKPSQLVGTFENVFGEKAALRTFRLWGERQRFGHPGAGDFVRTAEEALGRSLSDLFDPYLHGTGVMDYAVGPVVNREAKPPAGLYDRGAGLVTVKVSERDAEWGRTYEKQRPWESDVTIRRIGTVSWPVEVRVTFERGGESETRVWDGKDRWMRWTFPRKVVRVEVDPHRRLLLDVDWTNNSWSEHPDRRPALRLWERMIRWSEQVMQFYRNLG